MKIIVLKESGETRALRLNFRLILLIAFVSASLLALAANALIPDLLTAAQDRALIAEWRERLHAQDQELQQLQQRTDSESQAVGRQLAAMQARLLRMEALGTRVTQVANLDQGEFSFDSPAPIGGPSWVGESSLGWAEIQTTLQSLSADLRTRESELEVLESMLQDRDYRQATEIAGRPVTWGWMSSSFGSRVDPFSGRKAWHAGVDFAGREGSDVIAVASGVVVFAGKRAGYGKLVEINHGDGYVTRYAHHAKLSVETGEIVKKGQPIAVMGSTGRSTGPHVHFEVLRNGRHLDPTRYVARSR